MLKTRIIPCLDVKNGRVVKGINFKNLRDAGDPVEAAARYDQQGADEVTYLDIAATQEAVAELPAVIVRIGKSHRARRIGLITGIAVVTVAGGAVAFSIIRRSMQPDPSALPPSVEVDPHP